MIPMPQYSFLLLLLFFLLLSLAWLWYLYWFHHCPPHSKAVALHSAFHRLLKPRSPRDCPACCLASTPSSSVEPAPPPVRPWREVKSRRGAPKRVHPEGIPRPNPPRPPPATPHHHAQPCVGDGTHRPAEQHQT